MLRHLIQLAISAAIIVGASADFSIAVEKKAMQGRRATGAMIVAPPTTVTVVPPKTAAPLTKGECEGLGGKVEDNDLCGKNGQQACKTVDHHGVVRVACIDGVKN